MLESWISQSILISGESGAGKTEAMKICLTYLGELSAAALAKGRRGGGSSGGGDVVSGRLMQTNPVMEAVGNAKTIRNNNSSRFGKHFDVQFGEAGDIIGAFTSVYLLEKPRIANHMDGERNYHVFYMLCKVCAWHVHRMCIACASHVHGMCIACASRVHRMCITVFYLLCQAGEDVRSPIAVSKWQDYAVLNQAGTVGEVTTWNDSAEFKDMHSALLTLGFSVEQRTEMYTMLSLVLNLGNLQLAAADDGSKVQNVEQLAVCAHLLQVPPAALGDAVTYMTMGGGAIEEYKKPLEPKHAETARNSLLMHVYSLVFDWCVDVINDYIAVGDAAVCIGVLDIFGFENFSLNSFPQLCINFTNESLHNLFIEHVFKLEQQTYVREEVEWRFVDYEDNQPTLDLIGKRPLCILGQLDEACTNQAATDASLLQNLHQAFAGKAPVKSYVKPKKSADRTFAVKHYAGEVTYTIAGFVEKNKDALSKDIAALLEESTGWEQLRMLAVQDRQRKLDAAAASKASTKKGGPSKKKTVGRAFGESLTALNSKLSATQKHYIRCLKPNQTLQVCHPTCPSPRP